MDIQKGNAGENTKNFLRKISKMTEMVVYRKKHKKVYDISNNFHGGLYLYLSKARNEKV